MPATLQSRPDWKQQLAIRALPHESATVSLQDPHGIVLDLPDRSSWLTALCGRSRQRQIMLDPLGSEIYRLIGDGCLAIDLVRAFQLHHGLTFHEARHAVCDYLQALARKGVIRLQAPTND